MRAIILSRHDFREFDQRILCYTLERGKQEYVARGLKKITSKLSGMLEPGSLLSIETAEGKELEYLITAEPINLHPRLRADLKKLTLMTATLQRLSASLTNPEPDKKIFNLIESYLEHLDEETAEIYSSVLLGAFVIRLTSALGFTPQLEQCVVCGESIKEGWFSLSAGGIVHAACRAKLAAPTDRGARLTAEEVAQLKIWLNSSWDVVNAGAFSGKLEKLVLNFLLYHSEKKTLLR